MLGRPGGGIGSASTPNLATHYNPAPGGGSPSRTTSSSNLDAPPGLGPAPVLSHVPSNSSIAAGQGLSSAGSLTRQQNAQLEV